MMSGMTNKDSRVLNRVIIAEVGSVHDGSLGNACKLVEAAAQSGADVVKFQTHIAEAESLRDAPSPAYFSSEPRFEYFQRTSFTEKQWGEIARTCANSEVGFMSSPFSMEAVDLLESVGVDAYKVASGEITNIPLLEYIAKTRKPVYLSSGMSSWSELDRAVSVLQGNSELCIFQCTSAYPAPPERIGLNVISELVARYDVPVGFSDHAEGCAAAFAAAALGVTVFEKHFTFSKLMYGSDAKNGTEPEEFKAYCNGLREIWRMLDSPVDKSDVSEFAEMKLIFEKSVVTAQELKAGQMIDMQHLAFKKPGDGISAANYREIIGRRIKKDLPKDHKLHEGDFE